MADRTTGYVVGMTGDPSYPPPGDDPLAARAGTVPGEPAPPAPPPSTSDPDATTGTTGTTGTAGTTGTTATLPQHKIDRTRTGGLWVAAISAVVVIFLLLIFILQNGQQVEVALFGANPNLPLGVALLLAAVLGALIVALLGTARVVQLRHVAKKHRRQDRTAHR